MTYKLEGSRTMTPKTERFELRLEMDTLDRLDTWRSQQDDLPSRSEAIRRMIERGLSSSTKPEFAPDNTQKLALWLLTKVLKNQKNPDDDDDINLIQDTLLGGHFWALEWQMNGLLHNHVDTRENVTFVVDVLDMWSFIEDSSKTLSDADRDKIEAEIGAWYRNPQFIGFDGNHEGELRGIAQFMVEKLKRFEEFKGRTFNSHSPMTQRYRAMLEVFEPLRAGLIGRMLSADELIQIIRRG